MDIQFHGANCIVIGTKQGRLVIDDELADLGSKTITKAGDIVLQTKADGQVKEAAKLVIDQPGEYEISGVSIYGIGARSHMDEAGKKSATIYKILAEDISILVVGHIYPELNDNQLEAIGMVDIMFVPVGGNGYTLDAAGALTLVKKVEPKVVIPTHYDSNKLHFEVPQQPLEAALKTLAMEPSETTTKYKPKATELLADTSTKLIVVEEA